MANNKIKVIQLAAASTATPLWAAGDPFEHAVPSFSIQASKSTAYIGDSNLVGNDNGIKLQKGGFLNFSRMTIRGIDVHYNLSDVYYLSSQPVKLILEVYTK